MRECDSQSMEKKPAEFKPRLPRREAALDTANPDDNHIDYEKFDLQLYDKLVQTANEIQETLVESKNESKRSKFIDKSTALLLLSMMLFFSICYAVVFGEY